MRYRPRPTREVHGSRQLLERSNQCRPSSPWPYRFYFYSHEPSEPPHIHVDRDELSAKFWVGPVGLARNLGFRARELAEIERIVHDNEKRIIEAWHEYFGT